MAFGLWGRIRAYVEEPLTEQEVDVLQLAAKNSRNRLVGRALHISEAMVKTHLVHIFGKLGVSDRTSAVTVALERGIGAIQHKRAKMQKRRAFPSPLCPFASCVKNIFSSSRFRCGAGIPRCRVSPSFAQEGLEK